MNISNTRIQQFLITAKYLNMNKAANQLYISQPALSLSMSKLEEDLGVVLFYRTKNKLILSQEAEILLPRFQQIAHDYEGLFNSIKMFKQPVTDYINISFTGSTKIFARLYDEKVLEDYNTNIVKLSYVDIEQAQNMLLTGQTEFAFTYPPVNHPMITTEIIYEEPIGIVLPRTHPMAKKTKLDFIDIQNLKFHLLSKNHMFRRLVDSILSTKDITPVCATENSQSEYYKRMKESSLEYCFFSTPQNFNINFLSIGDYVYRSVNDEILNRKTGLSYLTNSKVQFKYAELINALKETIVSLLSSNNFDSKKEIMAHKDNKAK